MNLDGFNANEIEPNKPLDVLPPGKYKVVISESESKDTKSGNGSYLSLTLTVIDGEHLGRKLFDRLNLNNPNPTTVEIAKKTLSAICRATGVLTPQHSSDLHDIPLIAVVKVQPPKGEYDAKNEVKGYESCIGGTSPVTVPSGGAKTSPPAPDKAAPPWAKKK